MTMDDGDSTLTVNSFLGGALAVPIYSGYSFPSVTKRSIKYGGRDLTEHLARLLRGRGHAFTTSSELELVRTIKEATSYVAYDYQEELNQPESLANYTLPDGQVSLSHHYLTLFKHLNSELVAMSSLMDVPAKLYIEFSSSGTGKHGKCKIHFVGIDIFSNKRHEFHITSGKNAEVPVVEFNEFQLVNIDEDGYLSLLDNGGNLRSDLQLPSDLDLRKRIVKLFGDDRTLQLYVFRAMGREMVYQYKEIDGH
eukprot:gene17510-20889_t